MMKQDETEAFKALEKKYGTDFRKKLPMYETAKLDGEHVKLIYCSGISLEAIVRFSNGQTAHCRVAELDEFVL